MDAATLRIILLVLGVVLLGAMYLWERRRAGERGEQSPAPKTNPRPAPDRPQRREPSLSGRFMEDSSAEAVVPEVHDAPSESTPSAPVEPTVETRHEASPPLADPAKDAVIVQLFVFAVGEEFSGSAIQTAAEGQHLVPGEMKIYHRRSLDGASAKAQFSMANLVKPGTFPFEQMEGFSSPGLALFAQFDGRPSDLMVYDELVQTARALADELGGEVGKKDHRPFDATAAERLRSRLLRLIDARADALAGAPATWIADDSDTGTELSEPERDDNETSNPADTAPPRP